MNPALANGYKLTLSANGKTLMCDPPGPCRCGHAVAIFSIRGAEIGCAHCLPDTTEAKP